ncbi:glutathione-dependent formaldehyde-activating GFA [Aliiglaciecola lipolytica E3]|uniref:Glutathione-dependent formaldehyde-activating GFA n=2 Tax=Aliiglaciecola TaxID=1406885 RepID=K6YNI8_9ALTE|nr:glutathione-dependent formaldehyde-activating GFA [Aliiglaciecola lipolytica E3]
MLAIDNGMLKNITGESFITRYSSSEWAQRGFCNKCGTSLFYYLVPAEQYHFPVGLLDSELQFKFSHQIFIDEKPDYYFFGNETQNMTGAEVFAHFENEGNS